MFLGGGIQFYFVGFACVLDNNIVAFKHSERTLANPKITAPLLALDHRALPLHLNLIQLLLHLLIMSLAINLKHFLRALKISNALVQFRLLLLCFLKLGFCLLRFLFFLFDCFLQEFDLFLHAV